MGDSTFSGPLAEARALVHPSPAEGTKSIGTDSYRGTELAAALLRQVFRHLPFSFAVRLWAGSSFTVGAPEAAPADSRFTLWFRNPHAVSVLILGKDPLRLAEAYFRSDVDIEGDLFAALRLKDYLEALRLPVGERFSAALMARKLRKLNKHSLREIEGPAESRGSGLAPSHEIGRAHV